MEHSDGLILTLILTLSSIACHSSGASTQSAKAESQTVTLRPVAAVLKEEGIRVAPIVSYVGSSQELEDAQFVDANNGWVRSRYVLFRTSNAGKDWKRLDLNVPSTAYVSSFFFATPNQGWLTVVYPPETERNQTDARSSIMVTNDAGHTWNEQAHFHEAVRINNVSFQNADIGLAVGEKLIKEAQPYIEVFVVSTDDGGRTWTDISEKIKRAIQTPFKLGNDSGRQIRWLSSSKLFLLTKRGTAVVSDDGGQTWKTVAHFEDIRPGGFASTTAYYKLLFDTEGRLRLLAGGRGDEGYWGDLIVSDHRNTWQSYELIRIPLHDAMYLSDSEILASGQQLNRDEKTNAPLPPDGIILLSKDNGKSWSPIYRTGKDETLVSLAKVNETEFYAVSDKGSFIRFNFKLN